MIKKTLIIGSFAISLVIIAGCHRHVIAPAAAFVAGAAMVA